MKARVVSVRLLQVAIIALILQGSCLSHAIANNISLVEIESLEKVDESNLVGPVSLIISPDGKDAYAAYYEISATLIGHLNHYSRNSSTGELNLDLTGSATHSMSDDGLEEISNLIMSSDGSYLYASGGVFYATLALTSDRSGARV